MKGFLAKIVDRCFAVAGALLFCQLPLFIHQYVLLLSGHVTESKLQVAALEKTANLNGKTTQEYIQKFVSMNDADVSSLGEWMRNLIERCEHLTQSYSALEQATVWSKPFVFFTHVDPSIFSETVHQFSPGVPATLEGIVYAVVGIGIGIFCYWLLKKLLGKIAALFVRKTKKA